MWQNTQTIFLSIILESLPFILIGVIISSVIQELVSQERMLRLMPKNRIAAVFASSLLGLVLPVCDCGTIPVARSLMGKGMPTAAAMTFTLAAPVINPLTLFATYVAFGMNTTMMWMRAGATFSIAVLTGCALLYLEGGKRARTHAFQELAVTSAELLPMVETRTRRSVWKVGASVIEHAIIEFFEIGGFVVISAAVAALLQTYMPGSALAMVGEHPVWSVLAMMALAILLSLCSEADAFVARSLAGLTTTGGVLSFLVIGQMIDLRNIMLLPRVFPKPVVRRTYFLVILLTAYAGIMLNFML
jgi:uncharacterized protein